MSKKRRKKERSTASAAKRRAEEHGVGFEITSLNVPEGVKFFKIKSDKPIRLDILPYPVGKGNPWADEGEFHYERTYFVHRGIGAEQSSYVCPRKTTNERCPICEFRAKLAKDPDADENLIKSLAPKERQLFNVIDTRDREKGVQIWDIAWWLFGKALDARIRNADEDDDYDHFADLEGGSTLKLGVEEKYFDKRAFYAIDSIDFKRREDYDKDILEEVHNLDEMVKIIPYDELKKILLEAEDDDKDEDKKEKKTSKSNKKKKQQDKDKDDEDFDDEDEDFDDEDEDEEEKEKKTSKSNKKKKQQDEDEDFDDEDEDFDDEDEDDEKEKKTSKSEKKKRK